MRPKSKSPSGKSSLERLSQHAIFLSPCCSGLFVLPLSFRSKKKKTLIKTNWGMVHFTLPVEIAFAWSVKKNQRRDGIHVILETQVIQVNYFVHDSMMKWGGSVSDYVRVDTARKLEPIPENSYAISGIVKGICCRLQKKATDVELRIQHHSTWQQLNKFSSICQ